MKHLCAVLSSIVLAAVLVTTATQLCRSTTEQNEDLQCRCGMPGGSAGRQRRQRKAFMKECLSRQTGKKPAEVSQQNKMKTQQRCRRQRIWPAMNESL